MDERLRQYRIGLFKQSEQTVIVRLREYSDEFSPDMWEYIGTFMTTKKRLKTIKPELLTEINEKYSTNFKHIKID